MSAIEDQAGPRPTPGTKPPGAGPRRLPGGLPPPFRSRPGGRRRTLLPQFLLAPAVLLFLVFTVAPGLYAVYLSFLKPQIGGGLLGNEDPKDVFAGLENYRATLADSEFWHSILRMLLVAGIGVPATIFFATLFALCLDAKRARLVGIARLAIFLPYAVPGVIASLLWGFMYLPATSP